MRDGEGEGDVQEVVELSLLPCETRLRVMGLVFAGGWTSPTPPLRRPRQAVAVAVAVEAGHEGGKANRMISCR